MTPQCKSCSLTFHPSKWSERHGALPRHTFSDWLSHLPCEVLEEHSDQLAQPYALVVDRLASTSCIDFMCAVLTLVFEIHYSAALKCSYDSAADLEPPCSKILHCNHSRQATSAYPQQARVYSISDTLLT